MAVQIEFTAKPSINLSANNMIDAFIISKNNPKVIIVIGSVSMINIGFNNVFKIAKTAATIITVVYGGLNETPGKNLAKIIIATALRISFNIHFIINIFIGLRRP